MTLPLARGDMDYLSYMPSSVIAMADRNTLKESKLVLPSGEVHEK